MERPGRVGMSAGRGGPAAWQRVGLAVYEQARQGGMFIFSVSPVRLLSVGNPTSPPPSISITLWHLALTYSKQVE